MLIPGPTTTVARLRGLRPAAVRAGLGERLARATDALLAHAQPAAAGDAALASGPGPMRLPRPSRGQVTVVAAAAVAVLAVLAVTGGPMAELTQAFERAISADWGWVAVGVGFELASFLGYILLFWLVAGRATRKVGLRESAEISLAGAAATRLLPTGGLGGIALTLWALARAGLRPRAAVGTLLTFLVLLYAVFMAALATAGLLLLTGVAPGDGPLAFALVPALFGVTVIALATRLGAGGTTALGHAVRGATRVLRRPDPRLLGALAWWGFDLAALAATFHALGAPPPVAVLVLAYFTGAVANTIPLPGLVAGSTTGVLLAFGVDASLALPAVFAYRAIALWLPALTGTVAIAGLRATAARWHAETAQPVAPLAVLRVDTAARDARFVPAPRRIPAGVPACCDA